MGSGLIASWEAPYVFAHERQASAVSVFSLGKKFGQYYGPQPIAAPRATSDATSTSTDDVVEQLTQYIPGDILTVYLAATAAVAAAAGIFRQAAGASGASAQQATSLPEPFLGYAVWVFWVSWVFAMAWAYLGVFLASPGTPQPRVWFWPVFSAAIAFPAYAFAVPMGWLSNFGNASLFGTLTVLFVTPLLHAGGRFYTKILPPLPQNAHVRASNGVTVKAGELAGGGGEVRNLSQA
jgi:hypothetical protein